MTIQEKIYEIRGQKVMLDFDLAELYGVKTSRLNEQVKRNIERFPNDFMFQLTKGELEILRNDIWISQIATSNFVKMGLRKAPYAFTENGVAMLSSVLRSPLAIQVNIGIEKEEEFVAISKARREEIEDIRNFVGFRNKISDIVKSEETQQSLFGVGEPLSDEALPFLVE